MVNGGFFQNGGIKNEFYENISVVVIFLIVLMIDKF